MEDASMTFYHFIVSEPGLLELIVYVAGVHEVVTFHLFLAYLQEITEALMGCRCLVHIESMTIEEPELAGVSFKEGRIRRICKAHVCLLEERISFPESFLTSECCKSRVMSYTSSCCHE